MAHSYDQDIPTPKLQVTPTSAWVSTRCGTSLSRFQDIQEFVSGLPRLLEEHHATSGVTPDRTSPCQLRVYFDVNRVSEAELERLSWSSLTSTKASIVPCEGVLMPSAQDGDRLEVVAILVQAFSFRARAAEGAEL